MFGGQQRQPSGSDPTRVKYRQQSVPDHTLSSDCQSSKEQKAAQNTPVGLQEGPNQPPRGSNLPHGKQEQIFPNNCPQLPLAMLQQQNVFQVDLFLPGDGPHENPFNQYELQAQREVQQMRSIQASIQMLYDVFDYTIGMIEELEKHEKHGKQVQNSGILSHVIPVKRQKPIQDVFAGIELELKCLQAQMKALHPDITSQVKKGLIMQTLKWAASRSAADIPYSPVDDYCKNVLQILLSGAPQELPRGLNRAAPQITFTTEQVNEAMHQMAVQRHLGEKQDEDFDRDPRKKATLRSKRQTESIREGALRLITNDSQLALTLQEHGYVQDLFANTR